MSRPEPIAIVGIGCRLPGGLDSPAALWQALVEGRDLISEVPPERWDHRRFFDRDPDFVGKTRVRRAGFLRRDLNRFDAGFFGLSRREAELLDPRHWLLMESAWEALEDAGAVPSSLAGDAVGVYIGMFLNDSTLHRMGPMALSSLDSNLTRASSQTMLAARVSHFFDFRGPCLALDTACSGSLVATHLACQSIRSGESTRALVGGVNLLLRPEPMVVLDKGGFLSPDGTCRPFDARANGYVRSEGALTLLLEPLSLARQQGRRVYALIESSACNSDGRTPGITVPRVEAQATLLEGLFEDVELDPTQVDFVEAHGTGTPVGDPMEVESLRRVLAPGRSGEPCWIGSIKSNLGHLESAAGVAGLVKAALSLHHRTLPPSIHFQELNPEIDLGGALAVAQEPQPLARDRSAHALVNSFGYGGTNAGVLLSSPEPSPGHDDDLAPQGRGPWLLPVSARSAGALALQAAATADWLEAHPELPHQELARALWSQREHHRFRAGVVGEDRQELVDGLRKLAAGDKSPQIAVEMARRSRPVVFVYTGMGAQSWGMAQELLERDADARHDLAQCVAAWQKASGQDLAPLFDPGSTLRAAHQAGSPMSDPVHAQAANLAVQVVLTRWWARQGLHPSAVVGHSVGEVAAAWSVGMLDLDQAFTVIAARVEALTPLRGQGTMLAVRAAHEELQPMLGPELCVATVNSPGLCLLAGPRQALEALASELTASGRRASFVAVDVPYHHPSILPYEERFQQRLGDLRAGAPRLPFTSTWSGGRLDELAPDHWWRACSEVVRLDRAVEALVEQGFETFLEVGPHPTVTPSVVEACAAAGTRVAAAASLSRAVGDATSLARARARLYALGAWSPQVSATPRLRAGLPRYAWERERYEQLPTTIQRFLHGTNEHPLLQTRGTQSHLEWFSDLTDAFLPWLDEHQVAERVVFPGAAFIEAALAVGRELRGPGPVELAEVQLRRMLDPRERPRLHVLVERESGRVQFSSAPTTKETDWALNAAARVAPEARPPGPDPAPEALQGQGMQPVDVLDFYDQLELAGLGYGPGFRPVRALWRDDWSVLAQLQTSLDCQGYGVHPALLDGAFQTCLAALLGQLRLASPAIPVEARGVRWHRDMGPRGWVRARFERRGEQLVGELHLCDEQGRLALHIEELRYHQLGLGEALQGAARRYGSLWERLEPPETEESPEQEPSEQEPSTPTLWFVPVASDPFSAAVASSLQQQGLEVQRGELEDAPQGSTVVLPFGAQLQDGFSAAPVGAHGWVDDDAFPLLEALRGLAKADRLPERLVLLTERAYRLDASDPPVEPLHRALWGLLRVAGNELRGLRFHRVDADSDSLAQLPQLLEAWPEERELALRQGLAFRHRLVPRRTPDPGEPVPLDADLPLRLCAGGGVHGSVRFEEVPPREPAPDEITCRVWLAGLNYKDVLKAQRRLPAEYMARSFSGDQLGLEFVGEVVAKGAEVEQFELGQAVYGMARGSMSTYVSRRLSVDRRDGRVWAPTVWPVPEGRAPEEMVGVVNHATAWHALVGAARLREGETVLIHNAAGGVGLAAVELARLRGARILATAGTPAKRALLEERGVERVFHSRKLAFVDALKACCPEGVDVALGAFEGETLIHALELLAPFGRLVHLGKTDILRNAELPMRALDGNLSLIAFDLDLSEGQTALYDSLEELAEAQEASRLPALPLEIFPASEAERAFRALGGGEQIGKVALDLRQGPVPAFRSGRSAAPQPGWTVVVGGLGGLGLELARWLVRRGHTHLALMGRSGAREETLSTLRELEQEAEVRALAVDATDAEALGAALDQLRASKPITGVFHLASVWEDRPLAETDPAAFARVFRPKVHAAALLHDLTLRDPLQAFVLFSSISAVIGNPGQAAYVAANAWLNGLAHRRRSQGLPALAFELGLVGDLGVAADDPELTQRLRTRGIEAIAFEEALDELGKLLEQDAVQSAFAALDWTRIARAFRLPPRFSRLVEPEEGGGREAEIAAAIAELKRSPPSRRSHLGLKLMVRFIADVLGTDPSRVDPDLSLADMGFDSLMAVEFSLGLSQMAGVDLPTELVTSGASIREVAEAVATAIAEQSVEGAAG